MKECTTLFSSAEVARSRQRCNVGQPKAPRRLDTLDCIDDSSMNGVIAAAEFLGKSCASSPARTYVRDHSCAQTKPKAPIPPEHTQTPCNARRIRLPRDNGAIRQSSPSCQDSFRGRGVVMDERQEHRGPARAEERAHATIP